MPSGHTLSSQGLSWEILENVLENCLGIVGIYHLAKSDSIDDSIKVALTSVVLPDGDGLLRRIRDAILN